MSCTVTIDRFKIKNNYGSISGYPTASAPTPAPSWPLQLSVQQTSLYTIGLLNLTRGEYIEAHGKETFNDSITLVLRIRDIGKDTVTQELTVRLLLRQLTQFSLQRFGDESFRITYEFSDGPSAKRTFPFTFSNLKIERFGNGTFEVISGNIEASGQQFSFGVLNDPLEFRELLGTICAMTEFEFEKACREEAERYSINRDSDCTARLLYGSLSGIFNDEVHCKIICEK